MNKNKFLTWFGGAAICCFTPSFSAIAEAEKKEDLSIEVVSVIGSQRDFMMSAGSVSRIDEAELTQFEYDDIARILARVPGVNVRLEDGFGLRPNIGFRGVTPERSKKINIMEDGLLIGPAPYSAPAAYFFPITSKMVGVEVTKGPAAIKYGPNTVAGALNLITRGVPSEQQGQIDIALGSDGYEKAHAYYGLPITDRFGLLIEGVTIRSDGFQELVNGGDVGFEKNDYNVKMRYDLSSGDITQEVVFKANYADEISNFTYTGLTDEDFKDDPYLRYAGGQLDRMDWEHSAYTLSHFIETSDWSLATKVYRTDLDRAWNKLNKFVSSFGETVPSLLSIVSNPEDPRNAELLLVLRGELDGTAREILELGNNDRSLYSQGIQIDGDYIVTSNQVEHLIEFGVRFHDDEIQRNHTTENYFMRSGALTPTGEGTKPTTTNTEQTDAISMYLQDTITWGKFVVTAGVRYEDIDGTYQNRAVGAADDARQKSNDILLPRLSVLYQLSDESVVFAGVHRGFVPTSPFQEESIKFEESDNYELGYRYVNDTTLFESVAFFNDYSNLIESCSFSAGCDTDIAFSGGNVDVTGFEISAKTEFDLGMGLTMPINAMYTFTDSEFKESFYSPFALWNFVDAGNPLPYLAENQATLSIGLKGEKWAVQSNIAYTGSMPESAQLVESDDESLNNALTDTYSDSYTIVDLSAFYQFTDSLRGYAKVDNVLDAVRIVSRRPYGARPNRPQQFQVGMKYSF